MSYINVAYKALRITAKGTPAVIVAVALLLLVAAYILKPYLL